MDLHKLESYDIDFIHSIIQNEVEEGINIEFKSSGSLSKADAKKAELAKDISAFANANGGIIIYGIEEQNHKASSKSYIDGAEFSKEWLEQTISSGIQRPIPDLRIFPIRENGDLDKTIYVIQIPESMEAPHMAGKEKRFFKRHNFQVLQMEEYEVRQAYGRTAKSKLVISDFGINYLESEGIEAKFKCTIKIGNEGDVAEKDYKTNLYFCDHPKLFNVSWFTDGHGKNYHKTYMDDRKFKVTAPAISTLYPNEVLEVMEVMFKVVKLDLKEVFSQMTIQIGLYFSGGNDIVNISLEKYFYENERLFESY